MSDWWPNHPEPGTWEQPWACPTCGGQNLAVEASEAAPWNRDVAGGVGHFNYSCQDCGSQGFYYPHPDLVPNYETTVEVDAEGNRVVNCVCRNRVPIWNGWANKCDRCGREYNGNGTLLAPRSQWGQETGEGYYDENMGWHSDYEDEMSDYDLKWKNEYRDSNYGFRGSKYGFVVIAPDIAQLAENMRQRIMQREDIATLNDPGEQVPSADPQFGDLLDTVTPEYSNPKYNPDLYRRIDSTLRFLPDELFKFFPWVVTQIKRNTVTDAAGPTFTDSRHLRDILIQARNHMEYLRSQPRTSPNWAPVPDINQMDFPALEAWVYERNALGIDVGPSITWEAAHATSNALNLPMDGGKVYDVGNGYAIWTVQSEHDLKQEGSIMGHCVGGYCSIVQDGNTTIWSLRDAKGEPHATIELEPVYDQPPAAGLQRQITTLKLVQVQGKADQRAKPEYEQMVAAFLNHLVSLGWNVVKEVAIQDTSDLETWYRAGAGEDVGNYGWTDTYDLPETVYGDIWSLAQDIVERAANGWNVHTEAEALGELSRHMNGNSNEAVDALSSEVEDVIRREAEGIEERWRDERAKYEREYENWCSEKEDEHEEEFGDDEEYGYFECEDFEEWMENYYPDEAEDYIYEPDFREKALDDELGWDFEELPQRASSWRKQAALTPCGIEIGDPEREIVIEPLINPVPVPEPMPEPTPKPLPEPEREPEKVPVETRVARAPRVHVYDNESGDTTSSEVYDATQTICYCDADFSLGLSATGHEVGDGDVLVVPYEGVVGIMVSAWPVAITEETGSFHAPDLEYSGQLVPDAVGYWQALDDGAYWNSYQVAVQEAQKLNVKVAVIGDEEEPQMFIEPFKGERTLYVREWDSNQHVSPFASGPLAETADGSLILFSTIYQVPWTPLRAMEADQPPEAGNAHGIYAVKVGEEERAASYRSEPWVWVIISMWGKVVPHRAGYRAQYAYPYEILVPEGLIWWGKYTSEQVAEMLRNTYKVDVRVGQPPLKASPKSIPGWGYDPNNIPGYSTDVVIWEFDDGMVIKKVSPDDYDIEKAWNPSWSYKGGGEVYSLRDITDRPHATFEIKEGNENVRYSPTIHYLGGTTVDGQEARSEPHVAAYLAAIQNREEGYHFEDGWYILGRSVRTGYLYTHEPVTYTFYDPDGDPRAEVIVRDYSDQIAVQEINGLTDEDGGTVTRHVDPEARERIVQWFEALAGEGVDVGWDQSAEQGMADYPFSEETEYLDPTDSITVYDLDDLLAAYYEIEAEPERFTETVPYEDYNPEKVQEGDFDEYGLELWVYQEKAYLPDEINFYSTAWERIFEQVVAGIYDPSKLEGTVMRIERRYDIPKPIRYEYDPNNMEDLAEIARALYAVPAFLKGDASGGDWHNIDLLSWFTQQHAEGLQMAKEIEQEVYSQPEQERLFDPEPYRAHSLRNRLAQWFLDYLAFLFNTGHSSYGDQGQWTNWMSEPETIRAEMPPPQITFPETFSNWRKQANRLFQEEVPEQMLHGYRRVGFYGTPIRYALYGSEFETSHPYYYDRPGMVAFADVFEHEHGLDIGFVSVEPQFQGQGLARQLLQHLYDAHQGRIRWGKLMDDAMGHLKEDFRTRYPERTSSHDRALIAMSAWKESVDEGWKERWEPGETAYFEYHCNQSHDSAHAEWWYRSRQPVTVLEYYPGDRPDDEESWTARDRAEAGAPDTYRVRWQDGFEGDVFEDELLTGPEHYDATGYYCPPSQEEIDRARHSGSWPSQSTGPAPGGGTRSQRRSRAVQ